MASSHSSVRRSGAPALSHPFRPRPLVHAVRVILASGLWGGLIGPAEAREVLPVPLNAGQLGVNVGDASFAKDVTNTALTITQNVDKAILKWKTFDIEKGYSVEFKQPRSTSIALNTISDQSRPSEIFGKLTANGQIYLYNPSGIVFGKDSQVNVNTLVASTLKIKDDAWKNGITKQFDADGTAAFVKEDGAPTGSIKVENGAHIATADDKGQPVPNGRILMVGSEITNAGDVRADDGEVIMVASSDKVYLQEAPSDSAVTGLLVEVEKGGKVVNTEAGTISARRGNVTLMGFAVNQNGMVTATTSVRNNGSIRLLARELTGGEVRQNEGKYFFGPGSTYRPETTDKNGKFVPAESAKVTLGAKSSTQVQPEFGDTATAVGEQAQPQSRVEIYGKQVSLEAEADPTTDKLAAAQIVAPSGQIIVTAADRDASAINTPGRFRETRIDMAKGSSINVAGLKNVAKTMESNSIEVELRGNELRDAPLQRQGVLRNQKVFIDARKGTQVADVSSALRRIPQTIEERSTAGGTVSLDAPGEVTIKEGASIDVSGGSVKYAAGNVKTTQLVGSRSTVDIGDADPNVVYQGIRGVVSRFESGYVEGSRGGSLNIATEALSLNGLLKGEVIRGVYQRLLSGGNVPDAAELSINLTALNKVGQSVAFGKANSDPAAPFDPAAPTPLVLGGDFQRSSGFGKLTIKTNGELSVDAGTRVDVPDAGALSLTAGKVSVAGTIDAAGGSVNLATELNTPAKAVLKGDITLKSASKIDVSGRWNNDSPVFGGSTGSIVHNGGSIEAKALGTLTVEGGAELAADGGAWLQGSGAVVAGKGGSIALTTTVNDAENPLGSNLVLDPSANLHAFGLNKGGSLSLTTNEIVVTNGAESTTRTGGLSPLVLKNDLFGQGGFSKYTLTSNYRGVTLGSDANIVLQAGKWQLATAYQREASARSLAGTVDYLGPERLEAYERTPVDLTLAHRPPLGTLQVNTGVTLKEGSSIVAEPKAHIALVSEGNIEVGGRIEAKGGTIDLSILAPSDGERGTSFSASQGIFLDGKALLDVAGTSIIEPNVLGYRTGDLLAGGRVNLNAQRGYIVTASGSRIDVSGASDRFQRAASPAYRALHPDDKRFTTADSNGGKISLTAAEGLFLDGALAGKAGGSQAVDGSLAISLDKTYRNEPSTAPFPNGERILGLHAGTGSNVPAGWAPGREIPTDTYNGLGAVSTDTIANGGFAALSLKSNDQIVFKNTLTLDVANSLTVNAPVIGWEGGAGTATLKSDYVAIGSNLIRRATAETRTGLGNLDIKGRLVDLVGSVSLQDYATTRITSAGDIRMRGVAPDLANGASYQGEFKSAGDLTLRAAQIYPTTASTYAVNLTGSDSHLAIEQNAGTQGPVFSAGGDLTLSAATIDHGGTIKAPFGAVHFNAAKSIDFKDGATVSVTGQGVTGTYTVKNDKGEKVTKNVPIPFGRTPGGLDWLYPVVAITDKGTVLKGDVNITFDGPPAKSVDLNAPDISLNKGSKVDVSGGGDLYAFEFAAGLGGSVDVLNPADPKVLSGEFSYQTKFAILPSIGSGYAPYDHIEFPDSGLKVGDSIYLSGIPGVPAGEYALLPAHYALLPGAYLITPQTKAGYIEPGQVYTNADGAKIVAGFTKTAGSAESPLNWSAFAVETGSAARQRSEYQDHLASQFFPELAAKNGLSGVSSVLDAGSLTLAATKTLRLGGDIAAAAATGGKSGGVDLVAQDISVVGATSNGQNSASGTIEVLDADLNRLNVGTLGLGVSRSRNRDGTVKLKVDAQTVTVQPGAQLEGQEILLGAKDKVTVSDGAEVDGNVASTAKAASGYVVEGDAALLRVSSGSGVGYRHTGESGATGELTIAQGAKLKADGSMLLDASLNNTIKGDLLMQSGDLAIAASTISLGATPQGTSGAVLSDALLAGLKVDNLTLSSRGAINFYGPMNRQLTNVVLDAAELAGYGAKGDVAFIKATAITLSHGTSETVSDAATGHGSLNLTADRFEFGAGSYGVQGFDNISFTGTNDVRFSGTSQVTLGGDTQIATARISGATGGRLSLEAGGHSLSFDKTDGTTDAKLAVGLGTRFNATADSIKVATGFALPSGTAAFTALTGNLTLASGAHMDLSGKSLEFPGRTVVETMGGELSLVAKHGNVSLEDGSQILVKAGGSHVDAGRLNVSAVAGSANFGGSMDAGGGGQLAIDAKNLGTAGFSGLSSRAAAGGFDAALSVRLHEGDINVAANDVVKAHSVLLTADVGKIRVDGKVDASGATGGEVILSAGDQVSLEATGKILANGTQGKGGYVELASSKGVGSSADQQGLQLKQGGLIDVSGNTETNGGMVMLSAVRDDQQVSIAPVAATISGAGKTSSGKDKVFVAATKVEPTSDFSQIDTWKDDTSTFMTHADDIRQSLGGNVIVAPRLVVQGSGDLSLDQAWDLSSWRYTVGGDTVPGFLTIRTPGNLVMNQSISDGFAGSRLMTTDSWGINLVSGADLSSANWRDTVAGTGDMTLAPGAKVRTGTGAIELHAGGDITLQDQTSVIYTAGKATEIDRYGHISQRFADLSLKTEFPEQGGDIKIAASGDIIGAKSTQFIPDWQRRIGNFDTKLSETDRLAGRVANNELPTAWGINYDFQQNVGALGGGNVNIAAGGNMVNLQVMLPTNAKPMGVLNPNIQANTRTGYRPFLTNELGPVQGGGDLNVSAGGDIQGGQFFVDQGVAKIVSRGSIAGGDPNAIQFSSGPLFALGDAVFNVSSAGDLEVGAVYNPSVLAQQGKALPSTPFNVPTTFFRYSDRSAIRLNSLAGNIALLNDFNTVSSQYLDASGKEVLQDKLALQILPGTLDATAVAGNITLGSFNLYPSPSGNLSLVAGGNVQTNEGTSDVVVNMSDTDRSSLPSVTNTAQDLSNVKIAFDVIQQDMEKLHAAVPVHKGDPSRATIVAGGDINGNNILKLHLAKSAVVAAGRDITDIGLNIQNVNPNDLTLISAGQDLRYHISRRPGEGSLVLLQGLGINIDGPGQAHVIAGRDIDLGASDGITTWGNLRNRALDEVGATLELIAGLKSDRPYIDFLEQYVGTGGHYQYSSDGKVVYGLPGSEDSLNQAKNLTVDQQRELAVSIFFNELKVSSQEAAAGKGYKRGDDAIDALFPSTEKLADGTDSSISYNGDIKLFFSRIYTMDGGNIDMLVPGGLINAGLASAFVGDKKPGDLGIVTARGGAVEAYTSSDFQVNQSRVFAIASELNDYTPNFRMVSTETDDSEQPYKYLIESYKDVVAWSRKGNIDAGRGSKGALSVSNGRKGFDKDGNWTDDVPPTIDGSGVRAQLRGSLEPGNVYLAAPEGIVDAGEAGIGGKQVTIAARAIVGAGNIQTGSGGLSSNVATSPSTPVATPAAASSAAASATKTAGSPDDKDKDRSLNGADQKAAGPLMLSVDLLGFGDCSVSDVKDGKPGCG